jgi:hypothetical protein
MNNAGADLLYSIMLHVHCCYYYFDGCAGADKKHSIIFDIFLMVFSEFQNFSIFSALADAGRVTQLSKVGKGRYVIVTLSYMYEGLSIA